jgi:hypothetical protein
MRAFMHWRDQHDNHLFHLHPLHSTFSLLTSLLLAGLIVLALVESAR